MGHSGTKMTLNTYAAPGTAQELDHQRKLTVMQGGRRG